MIKPEKQFYIFGMGHREKMIYKDDKLTSFKTNEILYSFEVLKEKFLFDRYMVVIWTKNNEIYIIKENEDGIFIVQTSEDEKNIISETCLCESKINLPSFEEYKYPEQLRILHQEILTSFIDKTPVPNIYVYNTAWYRDSAMMALALEKTGNIELLRDWALSVAEIYDKNNKGNCEPDNLGQLAFVLSFFVDKDYFLIKEIVYEAKRIIKNGALTGITDYGHHEIYSTLWLKYALDRLGIDTSFIKVPMEFDNYARMFWMDRMGIERQTPYKNDYNDKYPYLWWAVKHFENEQVDPKYLEIKYPMSWEQEASEAKYEKIAPLSQIYADEKFSAPHSWHASEMFLYLIEMRK